MCSLEAFRLSKSARKTLESLRESFARHSKLTTRSYEIGVTNRIADNPIRRERLSLSLSLFPSLCSPRCSSKFATRYEAGRGSVNDSTASTSRGVALRYARVFLKTFMRLQRTVDFIVPIKAAAEGDEGADERLRRWQRRRQPRLKGT
jgi:hypothetical protein